MNGGVGHRLGSGLALLLLWYRPEAVALIQPLAWKLLYAAFVALKEKKKRMGALLTHQAWFENSKTDTVYFIHNMYILFFKVLK